MFPGPGLWEVSVTLTVYHRDTFTGRSRPHDGHWAFRDLYWAGCLQLLLSDWWHFHTVSTMSQPVCKLSSSCYVVLQRTHSQCSKSTPTPIFLQYKRVTNMLSLQPRWQLSKTQHAHFTVLTCWWWARQTYQIHHLRLACTTDTDWSVISFAVFLS